MTDETAGPGEVTERTMLDALHDRFGAVTGNGRRYVVAEHVRSHASFDARRTADLIAVDTWKSSRFERHFCEVKISRSDWLRELKEPEKSAEFTRCAERWWLAVPTLAIVAGGELPDGWGLLALTPSGQLRAAKTAPKHAGEAWGMEQAAVFARAAAKTADRRGRLAQIQETARLSGQPSRPEDTELIKSLWHDVSVARAAHKRAREAARTWKAAYAATSGVPCRWCGRPVTPKRLTRYGFDGWEHRDPADEAPCSEIRANTAAGRWRYVEPADDPGMEETTA
ncbi:MAG: hypothetical protein M0030_11445 [Actinomycetota bacterium]|nr:hypothetical protein [Actinomycetota bacterium]